MAPTIAQQRAKSKYHAKMMSNPEYRQRKSENATKLVVKKYREDENFRKNMLEYQYLKYYYKDAEEQSLKAIRRLF